MKWFACLLLSGCYASTELPPPSCNPVMVRCNEADYPPLTAMLPWQGPTLFVAPYPEPPAADTPASRLLKKLGK